MERTEYQKKTFKLKRNVDYLRNRRGIKKKRNDKRKNRSPQKKLQLEKRRVVLEEMFQEM